MKKGKAAKAMSVVGVVQSMSGSTWTVTMADASIVTVTINSATQYGSRAHPESPADFKIGTQILIVTGKNATGQGAITAKRVVSRVKVPPTSKSTPGATTPPATAPTS